MTDASITALALEESLLKEWSAFNTRVDGFATPPGTRAEADRMLRFAGNDSFVDSAVDALGLYLAGQSAFDRKLLCFLDLALIQRAQPDDITLLLKMVAHYAERNDLPALLGFSHRLRLYEGHPALGGVAKYCSEQLRRFDVATDNTTWAATAGVRPDSDQWHVGIRLGTTPPDYWLTRKSALKPHDVSLELLVSAPGQWRVQVARLDRLYSAQWRPGGITIDTDQPQLKAVSAWPTLTGHSVFPEFAATLGQHLRVQWQRLALVSAKDATVDRVRLLDWLHGCADSVQL